jgi:ethanolamine ammonia-lyase small subunit
LWQCVMQYYDPNVTVLDAKRTATSCSRSQGIPRTIG